MLFDSIQNKENYTDHPLIRQALDYLSSLRPGELPAPNTVLIPGVLFCNPVTLISRPETECIFEAHRKYLDLHYIIEGTEGIATSDIGALHTVTPYDEQKDITFLEGKEDGRYYLKPGQFMVCWPNDAHKVAIMDGQPVRIQKIVFKIKWGNAQ